VEYYVNVQLPNATVTTSDTITVTEPPATPAAPQAAAQNQEARFTAADLEKARSDEKDKLYGRLSKSDERLEAMAAELAQLRAEREERQRLEAEQTQAVADAEKAKRESEMSAKKLVEERSREWDDRFAQLQKERETERETLLKEAEFARMRAYVQERVGAERANIAPELIDLIGGNTPEEIDQSIELMKAKTTAILDGLRAAQEEAQQQVQIPRGVSPTGLSATGPGQGDSGVRQLSAQDIKNMSMGEYMKYREQLLGAAATRDPYKHGLLG
jgi:hypothetical protein